LSAACPSCGEAVNASARFCSACGSRTYGGRLASARLAEGERRNVTVLFADMVGSTQMIDGRDPEDLIDGLAAYRLAIREAVDRYDGFVLHYLGDGVVACFGYPLAHEDSAERAVHAALEILASVANLGASEAPIQVRVGVASGVVVSMANPATNRIEDNFTSVAFHVAARVQSLAAPGQAIVAGSTARLLGAAFELRPLGSQLLKGLAAPVELYEPAPARAFRTRFERRFDVTHTPLIDRTEERATIRRLLGEAAQGGARYICLVGEAGIGKSRLANVLNEEPGAVEFHLLSLQCNAALSNSVLHPHVQLLRRQCDFMRGDAAQARLAKLAGFLGTRPVGDPEAYALLASLLSIEGAPELRMSPPEQRARTLGVVRELMIREAGGKPLVIVYEDLHWADPTSRECLQGLVEASGRAPVLLIATTRPGHNVEWLERAGAHELRIDRLGPEDSSKIAASVGASAGLSEIDLSRIAKHADGVPLFVEEMTRMLVEAPDRRNSGDLPETLSDLLRERLDRLGPARALAQVGAVIGRDFSKEMLAAVAGIEPDKLEADTAALLESGLVEPTDNEAVLRFKHALIQDAAYASLLGRVRRDLHARAADVLQTRFPGLAERLPEQVARHLSAAQRPLDAAGWWLKAGGAAIGRGSAREAAAALEEGLAALAHEPEGEMRRRAELGLLAMLGPAQMVMKGPGSPDFGAVQQRAYDVCRTLPDAPARFPITYGLALYLWGSAQFEQALPLAAELDEAARADPTREHVLAAGNMNGMIRLHLGDAAEARRRLSQTVELYRPESDAPLYPKYMMDFGVFGRFYLGVACARTGDGALGARYAAEAVGLAEALNQPHSAGFAMLANFIVAMLNADAPSAREWATRCEPFASQMGFPEFVAFAHIAQGWADVSEGRVESGLERLEQGVEEWRLTGFETWQTWFGALRMDALNRLGRFDEALAEYERQRERMARNGERLFVDLLEAQARVAELRGAA